MERQPNGIPINNTDDTNTLCREVRELNQSAKGFMKLLAGNLPQQVHESISRRSALVPKPNTNLDGDAIPNIIPTSTAGATSLNPACLEDVPQFEEEDEVNRINKQTIEKIESSKNNSDYWNGWGDT